MKRLLVFTVIAALLISLPGCVTKTKHDKLQQEKAQLEKTCEDLKEKEAGLKNEISARQNEVRDLRAELKQAKNDLKILNKQLEELTGEKKK